MKLHLQVFTDLRRVLEHAAKVQHINHATCLGYIDATAESVNKLQSSMEKRRTGMEVNAHSWGIKSFDRAIDLLNARQRLSVNADQDGCLMPSVGPVYLEINVPTQLLQCLYQGGKRKKR